MSHCVAPTTGKSFSSIEVYSAVVYPHSDLIWRSILFFMRLHRVIILDSSIVSISNIVLWFLFFLLLATLSSFTISPWWGRDAWDCELCNPQCFPVSGPVRDVVNHLHSRDLADMPKNGVSFMICGGNNVSRFTFVVPVSNHNCIAEVEVCSSRVVLAPKTYMPLVHSYKEFEYQHALWDLIWSSPERDTPKVSLSSVVLRSPSCLFYMIDRLDYSWFNWAFEWCLSTHLHPLMLDWHNKEIFVIALASRPQHYSIAPSRLGDLEGHWLLFVATPTVSVNYVYYILSSHVIVVLTWRMATSEFSVCTLTAFLGFAPDGTVSAEGGPGSPRIWYSGMLVSLLWRLWHFGEDGHYGGSARFWFRHGIGVYGLLS